MVSASQDGRGNAEEQNVGYSAVMGAHPPVTTLAQSAVSLKNLIVYIEGEETREEEQSSRGMDQYSQQTVM